jgi:predicted transcriptional regulator
MPRPRTERKITRLSVSLDDRDYQAVRDLAKAYDVSTAWIMRRAVSAYLASASAEGANEAQARRRTP